MNSKNLPTLREKIGNIGTKVIVSIMLTYFCINLLVGLLALSLNIYFPIPSLESLVPSIQEISIYLEERNDFQRKKLVVYIYSFAWISWPLSLIAIIICYKLSLTNNVLNAYPQTLPRNFDTFFYKFFCPFVGAVLFLILMFYLTYHDNYIYISKLITTANKVAYINRDLFRPAFFLASSLFWFGGLITLIYQINTIKKKTS